MESLSSTVWVWAGIIGLVILALILASIANRHPTQKLAQFMEHFAFTYDNMRPVDLVLNQDGTFLVSLWRNFQEDTWLVDRRAIPAEQMRQDLTAHIKEPLRFQKISSAKIGPDGRTLIMVESDRKEFKIIDAFSGQLFSIDTNKEKPNKSAGKIVDVVFSQTGKEVAIVYERMIKRFLLVQSTPQEFRRVLKIHAVVETYTEGAEGKASTIKYSGPIEKIIGFSPDLRFAVVKIGRFFDLWDLQRSRCISHALEREVTACAFSPDSKIFVFGCENGNSYYADLSVVLDGKREELEYQDIKLFGVTTGFSSSAIQSYDFLLSPEGLKLVSGTKGGELVFWDVNDMKEKGWKWQDRKLNWYVDNTDHFWNSVEKIDVRYRSKGIPLMLTEHRQYRWDQTKLGVPRWTIKLWSEDKLLQKPLIGSKAGLSADLNILAVAAVDERPFERNEEVVDEVISASIKIYRW